MSKDRTQSNRDSQRGTESRAIAQQHVTSNYIAVEETVIHVKDHRHWLYATVDPTTNEFLHSRLFQTRTTHLIVLILCEFYEQQQIEQAFLFDGATALVGALSRLGLDLGYEHHGNWNSARRICY
jgi:transposase-like protein